MIIHKYNCGQSIDDTRLRVTFHSFYSRYILGAVPLDQHLQLCNEETIVFKYGKTVILVCPDLTISE